MDILERKKELTSNGECWATVQEFPQYEISTQGRVRKWMANETYRYPTLVKIHNGQYKVSFIDEETKIHGRMIAKLVYETFLGIETNKDIVYLDGDTKNCSLMNLATIGELVESYKEKINKESK